VDTTAASSFLSPDTIEQAVSSLQALGGAGGPLAGATWISRAPVRREALPRTYVSLAGIAALHEIRIDARQASIGSLATHAQIAGALVGCGDLQALAMAAGTSATPAIRRVATIGGNICTTAFSAADLVPPLLALEAQVEVRGEDGLSVQPIDTFLAQRRNRAHSDLVTRIILPRTARRSAHARLTLRKAGEYPVAHVSVAAAVDTDGRIATASIAVGSVEATARRWPGLEAAVIGRTPDPVEMKRIAAAHVQDFAGRDAVDAPGWYRERVLPGLVARAFGALSEREGTAS